MNGGQDARIEASLPKGSVPFYVDARDCKLGKVADLSDQCASSKKNQRCSCRTRKAYIESMPFQAKMAGGD